MKRNNIIILSVILALGLLTMLAMPQHKAVKPANEAAIDPAARSETSPTLLAAR